MLNFNRRSIRLKNYDYSSNGYYFVTICTYAREYLFGDIVDNKMILNKYGKIVESVWESLPEHHPVELDQFQIMPNHVHMIIIVGATRGSPLIYGGSPDNHGSQLKGGSRPSPTLGTILGLFKSEITKQIRLIMENPEFPIWQRNFYERIIRNEEELFKIREYIKLNPAMWDRDRNNLKNLIKNTK